MAERVDVLIAGTGFGGSITACRLAELYHAAGADPKAIVVLERGQRFKHTDFKQSMDDRPPVDVYKLIQGHGRAGRHRQRGRRRLEPLPGRVAPLAARDLRAPRPPRPATAPSGACGRRPISRKTLDPLLRARRARAARATGRRGTRCRSPAACGRPRSTPPATPATACRWRSARSAASNAKWCHTGCVFGAKNTLITNYLAAPSALGVQVRPERRGRSRCSQARRAAVPLHRARVDAAAQRRLSRSSARCWSSPPARWATRRS